MSYVITPSSPPSFPSFLPPPSFPPFFSLPAPSSVFLLPSLPPFLHLSFPPLPLSILVFFAKEPV